MSEWQARQSSFDGCCLKKDMFLPVEASQIEGKAKTKRSNRAGWLMFLIILIFLPVDFGIFV
ncbi:MAG: hypothetical protein HBSAPP04_04970 [Ignavibacteriaceae bacterium]|nr:MAG: hypothetical protein HBSAPP04_04970 [Ignavibacteriaceae bacterium]